MNQNELNTIVSSVRAAVAEARTAVARADQLLEQLDALEPDSASETPLKRPDGKLTDAGRGAVEGMLKAGTPTADVARHFDITYTAARHHRAKLIERGELSEPPGLGRGVGAGAPGITGVVRS